MRIALLLGLLPALAFGQSITLNLGSGGATTIAKNGSQCADHVAVNFSATVAGIACAPFQVFATTAATCPDTPASGDFTIGSQPNFNTQTSGTFDLVISDLPIFDGGTCPTAVDETLNICGTYKYAPVDCGFGSTVIHASPVPTVRFDAIPPSPPVVTAVNSLDSGLSVRVSPGSDASLVTVQYRIAGSTAAFTKLSPYDATNGGTTIDNLVNGTTYEVQAIVSDQAQNDSQPSASKTGTPEPTSGFWANYVQAGGKETGGCNALGPSWIGLLFIAAALGRARRKS